MPNHGRKRVAQAVSITTAALIVVLTALSIGPGFGRAASSSHPGFEKPTIVLVHGAWADGSAWTSVIRQLQGDGYRVLAPAVPLRSLAGDAGYLGSILLQEKGPFVLVGHSYGGAVITNAAVSN